MWVWVHCSYMDLSAVFLVGMRVGTSVELLPCTTDSCFQSEWEETGRVSYGSNRRLTEPLPKDWSLWSIGGRHLSFEKFGRSGTVL